MVKVFTKTIQHSYLTGFLFCGICFLYSQLAYSASPTAPLPSPVSTTNADLLTQAQRDTISNYRVGEYYSNHLRIVEISNPKKISIVAFTSRLHVLDSLLTLIKNGDSSAMANNFDLITFDFFPQDPPLTWVCKGYNQIEEGTIGIRTTNANGVDTTRDSTTAPYKGYDIRDKVLGGMASLNIVMTNDCIDNHPTFIRFRDRPYCYSLIFLANDTYFMVKTIYEN